MGVFLWISLDLLKEVHRGFRALGIAYLWNLIFCQQGTKHSAYCQQRLLTHLPESDASLVELAHDCVSTRLPIRSATLLSIIFDFDFPNVCGTFHPGGLNQLLNSP